MSAQNETTLVLIKPDAVWLGLIGALIARIESANLRIVGAKMMLLTQEQAKQHYHDLESRAGTAVFGVAVAYLSAGPVMVLAVSGENAARRVRKLVGATDPQRADSGTIRSDFMSISCDTAVAQQIPLQNRIHCTDPDEDGAVARELALYFGADELVNQYPTAADGIPVFVPIRT